MASPTNLSVHYRNCSICEAICGIEITQREDGTLDIRGDKDDPFSRGYICPKPSLYKIFISIEIA